MGEVGEAEEGPGRRRERWREGGEVVWGGTGEGGGWEEGRWATWSEEEIHTIQLPQHTVHSSRASTARHADVEFIRVLSALSLCLHRRSDSGCCVSHLGNAGYVYRSVFFCRRFVRVGIRKKMLFVRVYVCWYRYGYSIV